MKTVIISPYSQKLRNDGINPKNYPYWGEVVSQLVGRGIKVIQIGLHHETDIAPNIERRNNLSLMELKELVASSDTFASVDNFFHHFCALHKKPGVVVFGKSDPKIFGHSIHTNLLKDRKNLRRFQFAIWEEESYSDDVWVSPQIVVDAILNHIP